VNKYPLVLTLDSTGQPHRWSTWEEGVCYKVKDLIAWSLGDENVYFGGNNRITGEQSSVSVPSIVAIRNLTKIKNRNAVLTNRNLFGRDRNLCAYCGEYHADNKATRDHIIPVSRGGQNVWMNCVTACKYCNNKKDNKLLSEANMELLYAPYVPDRAEALILANRSILADQMEFLLAHLPKHSRARPQ
jgi:5-methylcytosine-specific restriction endonuclease McrA